MTTGSLLWYVRLQTLSFLCGPQDGVKDLRCRWQESVDARVSHFFTCIANHFGAATAACERRAALPSYQARRVNPRVPYHIGVTDQLLCVGAVRDENRRRPAHGDSGTATSGDDLERARPRTLPATIVRVTAWPPPPKTKVA